MLFLLLILEIFYIFFRLKLIKVFYDVLCFKRNHMTIFFRLSKKLLKIYYYIPNSNLNKISFFLVRIIVSAFICSKDPWR